MWTLLLNRTNLNFYTSEFCVVLECDSHQIFLESQSRKTIFINKKKEKKMCLLSLFASVCLPSSFFLCMSVFISLEIKEFTQEKKCFYDKSRLQNMTIRVF